MQSSVLLASALIAYAALHSLLASNRVKHLAMRLFGMLAEKCYRLAFNIVAGITFLPILALLTQNPGKVLYQLRQPWQTLMLGGQLFAVLLLVVGLLQSDPWHFFGLRQLAQPDNTSPNLIARGLYRWVRHPLYTAGLAFVWLTPLLTVNLLLFNILLSGYLYLGSFFEERRLVAEFGEPYLRYQRSVPRLIPVPWREHRELLDR